MITRARVVHLAAIAAVLASVLTLASPAAPPAAAETCAGVWVVVDARAAGGSLSTRCAPGSPATGLEALRAAGHPYAFVPRIPGMVCTIDARPDPCNGAPASAYWSYWHAEAGGSWTYASLGAGNRTPPPGSVEGWRFGDGSAPPGTAPPANRPPPPPAPDDDAAEGGASGSTGSSGGTSRSGSSGGSASGSSGGSGSTSSASDGAAGSTATGGTAAAPSAPAPSAEAPAASTSTGEAGDRDETGEQAEDEVAGAAPSWRPDPVATGEWENPPVDDIAPPDPAEEQREATGPAAEDEPTTALASHRTDGADPSSPVGGAVGLGLLAGIGVLTWRQRLRRARPTS